MREADPGKGAEIRTGHHQKYGEHQKWLERTEILLELFLGAEFVTRQAVGATHGRSMQLTRHLNDSNVGRGLLSGSSHQREQSIRKKNMSNVVDDEMLVVTLRGSLE